LEHKWDILCHEGLKFFGQATASISHELKNALAIVNESAGLLKDFCEMAERGRPLEGERFKSLAEKITAQIHRADGIVKDLNLLAHSVDEQVKQVDLGATLKLMVALSRRSASMRGIGLEFLPPPRPVVIKTNPFLLKNLVWLCVRFAMDAAGDGKRIGLTAEETQQGAQLKMSRLQALGEILSKGFPGKGEKAILTALGADLKTDTGAEELVIIVPKENLP